MIFFASSLSKVDSKTSSKFSLRQYCHPLQLSFNQHAILYVAANPITYIASLVFKKICKKNLRNLDYGTPLVWTEIKTTLHIFS